MKQLRLGVTLFQIKFYSWDTPYMFDGTGRTANEIYNKFKVDRTTINTPAYKSFIEIFTRASKNFLADTEVP
jgi:hypothetical protein